MSETDLNKLDLSGQCLRKNWKQPDKETCNKITSLHLNSNELSKLENLERFTNVVEFSATHNDIARMYPVSHLRHLVRLDLSYNDILLIEGLKDLTHLKYLNLSNNRIKTIEKLQSNVQLEHLDMSENAITGLCNISDLAKLKKLFLHKNHISQLRHAELYLPRSLEVLTIAGNKIADLAEISHLVNLISLKEFSIVSNPCVNKSSSPISGFDYRPYLINWCSSLKLIDGFAVGDIESLKAEWLYSQGRGRKFKPGQHNELVKYLIETCPLNSQSIMAEDERKLRLILSKAHLHQRQLKLAEQPVTSTDKMLAGELMSRSLDPTLLDCCSLQEDYTCVEPQKNGGSLTRSLCESVSYSTITEENSGKPCSAWAPLPAATKLVPVPESLVSPLVSNPPPIPLSNNVASQELLSADKLQTIKNLAQQKRDKKYDFSNQEQAAVCIQKIWRGYHTRNLNRHALSVLQHMQIRRTHQYIQKLSEDVLGMRKALDSDHKLQVLQMQAINALWKKVQDLQSSMQEVLHYVSPSNTCASSTQTEISAVHSPLCDDDKFLHFRPSSLQINQIVESENRKIEENETSFTKAPSTVNNI